MALKTLNRRNKKDLKWPKIIIAILSTIGIVDTGSITLKNWWLFTSLSCPGIQNGCETVLNSPWGTLYENNFAMQLTIWSPRKKKFDVIVKFYNMFDLRELKLMFLDPIDLIINNINKYLCSNKTIKFIFS